MVASMDFIDMNENSSIRTYFVHGINIKRLLDTDRFVDTEEPFYVLMPIERTDLKLAGKLSNGILTYISHCDIIVISKCDISYCNKKELSDMDLHIKKVYVPMTETGFYILLCLREPNHGYGIIQMVKEMTKGDIILAPGTMYGSLSKMEKDGLIRFIREEDKRKIYSITDLGNEVLDIEMRRIERLYTNMKEMR